MRCLSAKKIIIIVKDLVLWSRHDFFFVLIFIPFILHGLSPLIYSHSNLTITKNTGVGLNLYLSTPDATSASKDIWTRRTEILDGRALHPRCCSMHGISVKKYHPNEFPYCQKKFVSCKPSWSQSCIVRE